MQISEISEFKIFVYLVSELKTNCWLQKVFSKARSQQKLSGFWTQAIVAVIRKLPYTVFMVAKESLIPNSEEEPTLVCNEQEPTELYYSVACNDLSLS